eukprot:Skav235135  [mRNA]  locus=scaffold321:317837:321230:- [translate_table: standard]
MPSGPPGGAEKGYSGCGWLRVMGKRIDEIERREQAGTRLSRTREANVETQTKENVWGGHVRSQAMDRQSFFRPADDMDLMDPLSDFEDDKAISPPSGFAARSMALAAKKRGLGMAASSCGFS